MVFGGGTVSEVTSAPGKVLAISPDANTAIVADTKDSPNQVFICSNCGGSARTVTSFVTTTPATAAAFSPDNLKAYIVAGSTLYIYSKVDPLQTITLTGTANDAVFHPEGGFAYLAGPGAVISPYRVCDNLQIASANLPTANPPVMIRALPDGSSLLALEPPNIDIISTALSFTPAGLCTTTLTDTITTFNLGQGSFIPTQFFLSPNGQMAYILGETAAGPPPTRLPFIMTFNLGTQTSSLISLSGSAVPLSASLSPAGDLLFVGANDGTVHVINTSTGLDTQQVTFPFPTNELCFGPGKPATQVALSQTTISAAAQNGSNTTYTYKLIAGPALNVGESITVSNMTEGGDNGTFTISSLGTSGSGLTFTVANANGASASGQSGLGTVPITCNPDLVAVRP
jgi:WD40 repeat protein